MYSPHPGSFEAEEPKWYVIHTRSRHEAKVEWGLQARGLEVFLPRVTVRSRRRDRSQLIEVPLFSGYLFVHTDLSPWAYDGIVRHHGVVSILGSKGRCTPVATETVVSIRSILESGKPFYPWPRLASGRRVRVVDGPLVGSTGVILRLKKGKSRLVVGVDLLGRSVCVELAEETVDPL